MCLPFQSQTNMLKLHLMVAIRETSGSHEDEKYNNSRVMTYSSAVCSVLIHLVVSWCIPQHCVGNGMHRLILVSDCLQLCCELISLSHVPAMPQNQGGAQVIFSYVRSEFFTNNSGELPLYPHHVWSWHNTPTPNIAAVKIQLKTHLYYICVITPWHHKWPRMCCMMTYKTMNHVVIMIIVR